MIPSVLLPQATPIPGASPKERRRCDCHRVMPAAARNYRGRILHTDMIRPVGKERRDLATIVVKVTQRENICAYCVREILTNAIPYLLKQ